LNGDLNSDSIEPWIDLNALYEDAPCGYVSFTPDGTIIKINRTLLSWLNQESSRLVGQQRFTDLITKGGRLYYEMFYYPLLKLQSKVNEINFDFLRDDQSTFPALVNSSVVRDKNGNVLAFNATVFDITDRKLYENALLEAKNVADTERNQFKLLSDFVPEMIWTAEANGVINYANKRLTSFVGVAENGLLPENILQMVHIEDRFKLLKSWYQTIQTARDFQIEVRLRNLSGTFKWHLIRAHAIIDSDGHVSKWIGSCTDIDYHVVAIQHLDEFISIASHELRTPITTLKASLQLLTKLVPEDAGLVTSLMSRANTSIGKINSLVDDLLHAGNIKEGRMVLNKEQFNVAQLLKDTCPHIKAAGKYKLIIDCPSELVAFGDPHRIDQVLVNFVNNAIKYAPDSMEIFVSASSNNEGVRFSVKDKGPGIPAEKLPYIFDRYYRVNRSAGNYTGLGLGLYICSEIIKQHGGKIGVESKLKEGTLFWFLLPN
jgi:PAS domain S-box-containing protein